MDIIPSVLVIERLVCLCFSAVLCRTLSFPHCAWNRRTYQVGIIDPNVSTKLRLVTWANKTRSGGNGFE